ncbi:hypothetical protein OTK49_01430 [Vibrio coralliirubri]|uniref:hypothetical protein n=1 Tax=Vibrio coralliirubri TaxID=1516159 RepID=UPI0022835564|nr:hypothetical protein [Vibrio coralliirubri]MCY9861186.1 hypothetical protein [Vibrio coralliirubri]
MQNIDAFEDVNKQRTSGLLLTFMGASAMAGCVFLADYKFPLQVVMENVTLLGGISVTLLLLAIFSYSCGNGAFDAEVASCFKRSGVIYFLISLILALTQFFLFYFGMKSVTHMPNYVALVIYALVAIYTIIKIIKVTK